jgi:hypothetical protein
VIDRVVPLAEIHRGFQLMMDGIHSGKIIIGLPAAPDAAPNG